MNTKMRRPIVAAAVAATVLGIPAGASTAAADVVPSGGSSGQTSSGWSVTDTRAPDQGSAGTAAGGSGWTVTDTRPSQQGAAPAETTSRAGAPTGASVGTTRREITRGAAAGSSGSSGSSGVSGVSRRRSVARAGQRRRRLPGRTGWGWRPSRVCRPLTVSTMRAGERVWVVRSGDTLSLIASCTGRTVPELVAAAGLPDADAVLRIGQVLRLPRPVTAPAVAVQARRVGR